MVDKVKVIQDVYNGFLEGKMVFKYGGRILEDFKNDLIKWDDLKESNSDEFNSLTEKIYSKILSWRMGNIIVNKLNSASMERRIALIETDYSQIKKDFKNLTGLLVIFLF